MASLGHLRRALIFSAAFTLLLPPTAATTQSYAIARDKNLRGGAVEHSSTPDSPDGYGPASSDSDDSYSSGSPGAENAEVKAAKRVSAADAEAAEALAAYEEAKRALASQKIEQEEMRIRALEARQTQRDAAREQAELDAAVTAAEVELQSAEKSLNDARQERGANASAGAASAVDRAALRKDQVARKLSAARAEARGNRPYLQEMEANVRDFEGAFVMAAREAGMAAVRVKALRAEMVEKMERAADAQSAWQSMVQEEDRHSGSMIPSSAISEVTESSPATDRAGSTQAATKLITTIPHHVITSFKLPGGNADAVTLLRPLKAAAVKAKQLAYVARRDLEAMERNLRDADRKVDGVHEKIQLAKKRAELFAARAREQQAVAEEMAAAAAAATKRAFENPSPDAVTAFEVAVAAKKVSLHIAGTTAKKAERIAKKAEMRAEALRLTIAYHNNLKPLVDKHVASVRKAEAQADEAAAEFVNVWRRIRSRITIADLTTLLLTNSDVVPESSSLADNSTASGIAGGPAAAVAVALQRISASEAEEFVTRALLKEAVAVSEAAKVAAEEARIRAFEAKKEAREKRQEQENVEGEAEEAEFQAREAEKDVRQAKERAAQIAELLVEQRKVAEEVAAEREVARKRAYVEGSEEAHQAMDLATAVSEEGARVLAEIIRKTRRAAEKVSLREDHWRQAVSYRKETMQLAENSKALLEGLERRAAQAEREFSTAKEAAKNADELVKKLKLLLLNRHEESKMLRQHQWKSSQASKS
ncbi:unnamed protein product [Closterium sp. NIES-65]|nr:unnamed protein product [Closterium sp. NIES-65]